VTAAACPRATAGAARRAACPADGRGGGPAEDLLHLHGEHRLVGGVVHGDPGPRGHLDPLRGELVEPGGLSVVEQRAQGRRRRRRGRDRRGCGRGPGRGSTTGRGRRGGRRRTRRASRHPRCREHAVQGGEPVAPAVGRARSTATARGLRCARRAAQPPRGRRVGGVEANLAQHDRAEPAHPAGDDVAVGPAHLVLLDEQRGRGQFGQLPIRGGGQPDPPVLRARRPIREGDRQPFPARQRAPGRQLHGRAAGHEVDVAVQPLRAHACRPPTREPLG
jgi:hypothetical protein